jgi:hypothetical protein
MERHLYTKILHAHDKISKPIITFTGTFGLPLSEQYIPENMLSSILEKTSSKNQATE